MFLKINYDNTTKKVKFQEKYHNFEEFKNFISDISKTPYE